MKKIYIILALCFTANFSVLAQKKTSGAIQYEQTFDPAAAMAASGIQIPETMQARIPSSSKSPFELLFSATHASYMRAPEYQDSNNTGGGRSFGGGGFMRMGGANREYYYTLADQKVISVFEMSDSTFYMPETLKLDLNANMPPAAPRNAEGGANRRVVTPAVVEVVKTENTKKIVGLDCKEVLIKSTRKVNILGEEREIVDETRLWYTTELGFNFSPNPNLWTEGVVLAIESKGGSTIATDIEYRNVSSRDVTAPKKIHLITPEQYGQKMEAQRERFRNMRPPGGPGMMRPRNN